MDVFIFLCFLFRAAVIFDIFCELSGDVGCKVSGEVSREMEYLVLQTPWNGLYATLFVISYILRNNAAAPLKEGCTCK